MAVALEKPVPTKNPRVVVYLNETLKAKLEKLAAKRNRSVSNLLETLVKEEVDRAEREGEIDA
ncbi:ribbon-helix-helix protein, CopG family [Trichocoleus desertorum AS-A10]|uniref:ribbon-helix-helix domain-containing protein n=1 Tax=Trichocoleus desertorum TaxID=1481672 RepID=UPI00329987F5